MMSTTFAKSHNMGVAVESERAWCAGFYDGEGCCSAGTTKDKRWNTENTYVRIQVQQKGKECLQRFQQAVGVGTINPTGRGGMYSFDIGSMVGVGTVLRALWPFLSTPKKWQAIKAYQTKYRRNHEAKLINLNAPTNGGV